MWRKVINKLLVFILIALFLPVTPSFAFGVGPTGEVNGLPYVIYNSTYGLYYGVIGKAKNIFDKQESLTLAAWMISNGGTGASFVFALPDDDFRQGKEYDLAFDLSGAVGRTVSERYFGLGSNSPGDDYTTFNNKHSKLTFEFSHTLNTNLIVEGDLFFANNEFSNIEQGLVPLSSEVEKNCRNYSGGSLKFTIDRRDQGMDPHSGALVISNVDFGIKTAEYVKVGVDARGYFTPFDPGQVLAVRGMVTQMTGTVIPIYEYASLGGNSMMRGYTLNRWRDKAAALVNLEYRIPTPVFMLKGLSTVFFFEGGKVGEQLSGLGLGDWPTDMGIGLHINLGGNVIVRGDFGFGQEGMNVYFFYNQAF